MERLEQYGKHSFNYYTVRLAGSGEDRDRLQAHLRESGIATAVYYPLSLHLQPAFQSLGYQKGDLPETERAQEEVLSLPLYPELESRAQERAVAAIAELGRENT